MPQPWLKSVVIVVVFLIPGTAWATAGTFTAFGPQSYQRGTGAPVTVTTTFSVLNPNTQYTLKAFNGGLLDSQTELVSNGFVTVNGVQVIGPNNFGQQVSEVDVPVTLQASNTLSVQLRGQPGGILAIEIIGVDNDLPTIQASVSPAPNSAGWNNTDVTVAFVCADATSAVTCPSPRTVTSEGANQVISGTATDAAGNSASASVTLNIDKTPPNVSIASPANGEALASSLVTVTGAVSDGLSGVAAVVCDGAPAAVTGGTFSCSVTLTPGSNTITVQAVDVAGNFASAIETVTFASTPVISSFSPHAAPAGGLSFTLNVTGSNFVAGSIVEWNGSNRPTTFVSDKKLQAAIPASDLASAGTATVTVVNPGGGSSNAVIVSIASPAILFLSRRAFDGSDNANNTFNIWDMNPDGSGAKPLSQLTATGTSSLGAVWSPDGGKIVFDSLRALDGSDATNGTADNIWVMNPDGSGAQPLTQLTVPGVPSGGPVWSPDAGKIAFFSSGALDGSDAANTNNLSNIWVMNADGSGAQPLTQLTTASSGLPRWSRDGGKIAFESFRALDGSDAANTNFTDNIWVMNADGSGAKPLTQLTAAGSIEPLWSPDDSKITFRSARTLDGTDNVNTNFTENIWVMNSDGSSARPLTQLTAAGADCIFPSQL